MNRCPPYQRARRGISLVETVIAAAMLGGALAATLNVVGQAARRSAHDGREATATLLAQELIAEIRTRPLAGTSARNDDLASPGRQGFNDVEDYWSISETPPELEDGTRHPRGTGYTREVTGWYLNAEHITNAGTQADAAMVEVTISKNGAPVTTMRTIITREATP